MQWTLEKIFVLLTWIILTIWVVLNWDLTLSLFHVSIWVDYLQISLTVCLEQCLNDQGNST